METKKPTEQVGPTVTIERHCTGCSYFVARFHGDYSDAGYSMEYGYSCRHPLGRVLPGGGPTVRSDDRTPNWCPELPAEGGEQALRELAEALGMVDGDNGERVASWDECLARVRENRNRAEASAVEAVEDALDLSLRF
jgi:hypothetical protein